MLQPRAQLVRVLRVRRGVCTGLCMYGICIRAVRFCSWMRLRKTRNTRDRSIPRTLQKKSFDGILDLTADVFNFIRSTYVPGTWYNICAGTWKSIWKSFLWYQVDLNGPYVAVQWYQYAAERRTASFSTSSLPSCNLSLTGTEQQHLYPHHQQ